MHRHNFLSLLQSIESTLHNAVLEIRQNIENYQLNHNIGILQPRIRDIFVIMPFADRHMDTWWAIKRAVKRSGKYFRVNRVDEIPGAIRITDEILNYIQRSVLIICDLTEERPNVYLEFGFALALQKSIICIAKEGSKIHSNMSDFKIIFFNTFCDLETKLAFEIAKLSLTHVSEN